MTIIHRKPRRATIKRLFFFKKRSPTFVMSIPVAIWIGCPRITGQPYDGTFDLVAKTSMVKILSHTPALVDLCLYIAGVSTYFGYVNDDKGSSDITKSIQTVLAEQLTIILAKKQGTANVVAVSEADVDAKIYFGATAYAKLINCYH
jgi:hypothetical protein